MITRRKRRMGLVVVGEAAVVVALVSTAIFGVGEKGIDSRLSTRSLFRGEEEEEERGIEENDDDDDDDFADGKDYDDADYDDDYVLVSRRC